MHAVARVEVCVIPRIGRSSHTDLKKEFVYYWLYICNIYYRSFWFRVTYAKCIRWNRWSEWTYVQSKMHINGLVDFRPILQLQFDIVNCWSLLNIDQLIAIIPTILTITVQAISFSSIHLKWIFSKPNKNREFIDFCSIICCLYWYLQNCKTTHFHYMEVSAWHISSAAIITTAMIRYFQHSNKYSRTVYELRFSATILFCLSLFWFVMIRIKMSIGETISHTSRVQYNCIHVTVA